MFRSGGAYAPETGMAVISVDIYGGIAVITFEDRDVGGLGIFMVKKSMDDVRYEYREGKNTLTLEKGLVSI